MRVVRLIVAVGFGVVMIALTFIVSRLGGVLQVDRFYLYTDIIFVRILMLCNEIKHILSTFFEDTDQVWRVVFLRHNAVWS